MQDALKKFNARVLEENEKEEARKNRHNSRSNSWDSLMVALPVAHSPLSVVSAPPPKHNPLHTPPSRDNSRSASSSSGGMVPTTLTSAASLPPRVTTVSQISPKPSSPRSNRVTTTTTSSNHSSSSVPASVPRGSANSSENGTTLHTTPSSPFFAQGLRCGLPRTVKLEQQQLGSARTLQAAASQSHMRLSPTSSSRDEVNTPPIVDTPRPAKTVVGKPQIEAPRLPPSPCTASPAIPNLPGRYVQVSSADEQKNSQSTVENPLIGPMPLMPSPSLVVGPVYSAVEIQESTSLSTGSSNGRWGPSSDAKRPSVSSSNGGQAGADKTIITTTPGVSRATTLQPMRQPTQPVLRKNHRIDELNYIREEAPAEQSSATLSHNTPGALPLTSSPSSSASQNCGASNGRPPASPSRSDEPHDAGPHRLSHANSNGSDDSSPVTELPLFSSTDERPGKCSPNSAAAKETVATITAPKSPKFINSSPAAGQSPSSAASTKVPPLANGSSGGSLTQCPGSALNHSGRYSPARGNPNASTSAGRHANDQHQSSAGTAIPDDDAETAALSSYLMEEDLNLSLSTFNRIGSTLAQSLTLRVLNLKGSTISSEGLRGLADISTLKSIGVSHMRYLTTLAPLVTPTARANGRHCGIEEIDAQFSPLTNEGIGGLEKLRWLRRLDLSMTPISDVTGLAASHSLKDLYLNGTRVDSPGLAGLEQLPMLSLLNIARTKVTSLKQVAKSRSIQTLIAYSCQITDDGFIGVGEMPRLSTLDVSTTKVTNLSVLQKSPSLKSLRAQWLSLKNCHDIIQQRRAQMDGLTPDNSVAWRDTEAGFAGLANIPTLESLDMSFNTIRSLHSLCRSKSLKHLLLRRTRVDNDGIGGIAQLAGTLETLVITNLTDILDENDETEASAALNGASGLLSSIGDIHSMHRLTSIDLSFTDVYDLRLLQDLRTLRELVIVETLVTVDGLRGIEKIPTLETLDISQTSILSLQFLASGAPALKSILVKSNRNVRGFKLGRIDELRALQHLDVSDTVVEDIEAALKSAWRLKKLVWRWKDRRDSKGPAPALECWVTSPRLARMNAMPCLTTLDLTNSSVHDLAFLERSTSLTTLYLKCCRLLRNSAVKSLGTLPGLEVLELTDNRHISDVTCLRTCRRLRELHLNHTHVTKAGLKGVTDLPELKVLDIANTRAEDDVKDEDVNGAMERSRLLEDSNLREGSTLLDSSAAPAQFRVPRRRRVSFVASDGSEAVPRKPDRCE
ncbi:Leucine Rich repeat, putative [Leishmania lindenbergi]|uniref:Leucine Rich repeat n=1 Tax=Leishmania lindenbergi TaxID=651832 RepID=A0AAW3ALA8_9TRYP